MPWSTHGSRVNLHGWGENVVTTGGGDLFNGGTNRTYTAGFNGTSSASPIVAAAVAQVSSMAQAKGITVAPRDMRDLLQRTGTQGVAGQQIGSLPNVPAALTALGIPTTAPVTASLANGDFEKGTDGWTGATEAITSTGLPAAGGSWKAAMGGKGRSNTQRLETPLTVPTSGGQLRFDFRAVTAETTRWTAYDRFTVQLVDTYGTVVKTLATRSNLNASSNWTTTTVPLTGLEGRRLTLRLTSVEDSYAATTFLVDNIAVGA